MNGPGNWASCLSRTTPSSCRPDTSCSISPTPAILRSSPSKASGSWPVPISTLSKTTPVNRGTDSVVHRHLCYALHSTSKCSLIQVTCETLEDGNMVMRKSSGALHWELKHMKLATATCCMVQQPNNLLRGAYGKRTEACM